MFTNSLWKFITLALLMISGVLANEHRNCYCKINNVPNNCLTQKACEHYKENEKIFEKDSPESVQVKMMWTICATIAPKDGGRMQFVTGFGGNEFEDSCKAAIASGQCPGSDGDLKSQCPD
ncbi:hypothetical protein CGCA056_v005731 [Colletotrichum aenigma]|uniref:uncharacterized protein n=1 Tax=Colletotrichum aenigma TaxID=1215731 RepID=UPI0018721A86|nr:uncharacterized protein CGCA056_v005731 [Colletotrichum aenigma]KAF5523270.1 hypothetical protein CGCA056_v005731 [Colletotrichum aenigma]